MGGLKQERDIGVFELGFVCEKVCHVVCEVMFVKVVTDFRCLFVEKFIMCLGIS